MKKVFIALLALMTATCTMAQNAEYVSMKSFSLGVGPVGGTYYSIKDNGDKYKYNYKNLMNYHISYEYMKNFKGWMAECNLTTGKLGSCTIPIGATLDPTIKDKLNSASIAVYGMKAFPVGEGQLVFPVYIGGSFDIDGVKGGGTEYDMDFISLAVKARMDYYLGERFGLYAGVNAKGGYGFKMSDSDSNSDDKSPTGMRLLWYVDVGIVFHLFK